MSNQQISMSSQASQSSIASSLQELGRVANRYFERAMDYSPIMVADMSTSDSIQLLKRMISTRSTISTASSFANESNHHNQNMILTYFEMIGEGQCGKVWSFIGSRFVYKIPIVTAKHEKLFNDFVNHLCVQEAFGNVPPNMRAHVYVPKVRGWLCPDHPDWQAVHHRFPPTQEKPKFALVTQAILSIPRPCRKALVDFFCPPHLQNKKDQMVADPNNQRCLLRIYLGRRDKNFRKGINWLRLKNFPLLINDLEDLNSDVMRLAGAMADTLAILHWVAHLDANDVEFVFGSSPRSMPSSQKAMTQGPFSKQPSLVTDDFQKRHIRMWLLDFNQCQRFEKNSEGLKQICKAFWFNDPYYPRPVSEESNDVALWIVFRDRYLHSSRQLTDNNMPDMFIQSLEAEGDRRRKQAKASGQSSLLGQILS